MAMLSPSDSDSLPDLAQALAASQAIPVLNLKKLHKHATKPKRPPPSAPPQSSRPRKKPRFQGPKANGKAKASTPIELTSEDEPKPRSVKHKLNASRTSRRPSPADVIDLCSDHDAAPHLPQEEIIVLLSSDNDEATNLPLPPLQPQTAPAPRSPNSNANCHTPPTRTPVTAASVPPIEVLQTDPEDTRTDGDGVSEEPLDLTSPKRISRRSSSSVSPVPLVDQGPSLPPPAIGETRVIEDEEPSRPLQEIYNEAFQNAPECDETDLPLCAFSSRTRLKPYSKAKTHDAGAFASDTSYPPLLTSSFFRRVQQTLSSPRHETAPAQVNNMSPPTMFVAPTSGESPSKAQLSEAHIGPRLTPSLNPSEPNSMFVQETVQAVLPTEPLLTQVVIKLDVPQSSPVENTPPSSSAIPSHQPPPPNPLHLHERGYTPTLPIQSAAEEPRACSSGDIDLIPPIDTISDAQTNGNLVPEPDSALDIQEIEDMLLPKTSQEPTDEELLAIGLGYPG